MSFTVGSMLSTSSSLTFGPSRVDIAWDGASDGRISILPVCTDTANTAAYSVRVLRVFGESGQKTVSVPFGTALSTYTNSVTPGQAYFGVPLGTTLTTFFSPFAVAHTLNTATGVVAFELNPGNTNYTANTDILTTSPYYYTWQMTQTRGTATQVVALGKITRVPNNPYAEIGPAGNLVESQTAHFCLG